MDEGLLNDLLECSVCLERLDTSSKVLPCQHTFCRKCLQEIVHKHRELRCPECRVLVSVSVDDLPPNVLLMRILEGMRNAAPKKSQRGGHRNAANVLNSAVAQHQVLEQQQRTVQAKLSASAGQHVLPVLHQPYAKAMYDYAAKEAGDLSFKRGDIIILKKRIDTNWYQGECGGKEGVFPLSYVHIITPVPSHIPQCKALYEFRMSNDEEEGCLAFNKGDIINVIRRVDENWAEGKLDGKIGIFPLAFVELNSLARSLMKLSSNAQPGPSRLAPPTPTAEDSTPLIPTDHTRNIVAQTTPLPSAHPPPQAQQLTTSDSSSTVSSGGNSTTPNISSSNTSSSSSTAPSSPASPPPRAPPKNITQKPDVLLQNSPKPSSTTGTPQRSPNIATSTSHSLQQQQHHHNKEKRHSFTGLPQTHQSSASHRHSVELVPVETSRRSTEIQLPKAYIALYPYKPNKPDELELKKGGIYMVTERCQDGWFKGTSNRTQKTGVFPGNYVAPARTTTSTTSGQTSANTSRDADDLSKAAGQSKDAKIKGTVSLMRRLTSMKRSKSPPASTYSMDNPVFEDIAPVAAAAAVASPSHPVHVRGESTNPAGGSSSPEIHRHRKSNSLDAGKTKTQTVRERFRCLAPYPPNSEYELELQVGDIIYVHKKREDGWYKGTQQRTGRTGLFPASFVEAF